MKRSDEYNPYYPDSMNSPKPENAPQLGTCARNNGVHGRLHQRDSFNMPCENWKPVAAPENQPRPIQHICGHGTFAEPCKICAGSYHHAVFDRIPAGEAQGVPQCAHFKAHRIIMESNLVEWQCDDCPVVFARVESGAHPPPDEELVIEIARELYDRFVMGGWEPQDAYPQIREWMGRARAPQPPVNMEVTDPWSTPATNAGLSRNPSTLCDAETTGTISAPSATESSSLDRSRTEAPVAPSKLSAQEFIVQWRLATCNQEYLDDPDVCKFAEAYAREYASSSNAALEQMRVTAQLWKGRVEALEGQLREAREDAELQKSLASAKIPFCGHLAQYSRTEDGGKHIMCLICEVERLQEALRVERLKVLAEIHAYQTKRMWDGAISFMKKDISDYERAALGDPEQKGGAS